MLFGHSNTRVSPDVSSQGSMSKVSSVETSQFIPCHEWYSVLLGGTQLSAGVDQVGNLVLSFVVDQVGKLKFSRYVYGPLSWYEGECVS